MSRAQKIRKDIIEILLKIEDVNTLKSIHYGLTQEKTSVNSEMPSFMEGVRPIRDKVSLEEMIIEQNYKPVTYEKFRANIDDFEWEETLDELLEALSN